MAKLPSNGNEISHCHAGSDTPSRLELVEAFIWKSLDPMSPSSRNNLGVGWECASFNDSPSFHLFKTFDFSISVQNSSA